MKPTYPIVLIEWKDHESEDAWGKLSDAFKGDPPWINTIGWLIRENDECYIVAATIADDGEGCQVIRILKGTVIQIKRLRQPRKEKKK